MKKLLQNTQTVTLKGYELNDIADYADIDTTGLISSVHILLNSYDHKSVDIEDLYCLTREVIKVASSINALQETIQSVCDNISQ